ncbi:MAG TPA: thiamine phosphate synthase [Thermohalobaculum sp.]|nr:thiamine phosphate synthase [Thermohalobaculum sp.]
MTRAASPARLYLVTPKDFEPESFAVLAGRALSAHGVACLRLDLGAAPEEKWRVAANHLLPVAHAHDVALVIVDHHRLVTPLGLDGVHLAASRTPVREVRKALGPDRIIGAFAGVSRHIGMTLGEAGADYVAFGPVGDPGALGDGSRAGDEIFEWWAEMIEIPVVAEGGATPADAARLAPIADFVAPDPAVWSSPEGIEAALAPYAAALAK